MKQSYYSRCGGIIFYTSKLIVSQKPWEKNNDHAFIIDAGMYSLDARLPMRVP